ncbi:MAG: diacylglycerol/lipid kinase family protein [Candidatus Eiseniibacteriota bacterium]
MFVLVNPAAGRGRRADRIPHFRELLRREFPAYREAVTSRPGEEDALIDGALRDGHDAIVAVGGDGTWSRAADRILRGPRRDVALGLLASGTGNDFGKSLGVTFERSAEVVRAIAAGRTRRIDAGLVADRYFLNIVGFGFDIAVIDDAARTPLLRGDLLYRFCALRQLFRFPGTMLEIAEGSGPARRAAHLMLVVANGGIFGGSFRIAPRAELADGRLDLVSIADAGPLRRARLFDLVARGRHEGQREVEILTGDAFRVGFDAPIRYEVDGEVCTAGESPLVIRSVPAAIEVFVPG